MNKYINEDQVEDYIAYNIKQIAEYNDVSIEEATENVRYYMDYLVNSVAAHMENQS